MNRNNYISLILSAVYSLSLAASPAEYLYQRGRHFLEQHDKENALLVLTKAHELDPNYDEITIQIASVYFFSREYQKAIPYFQHYLTRKPYDTDMLFYLGSAYNHLGNFARANQQFKQSYDISHDDIARIELLKNHIRDMEWSDAEQYLTPELWWYNSNLYGKRIVLDMAQDGNGIGDIIFFLRYAKTVTQAGAHVSVVVPKLLHPLCKCCPYVNEVVENKNDLTYPYDQSYSICIASLILRSKHKLHYASQDVPYLTIPQQLSDQWREKLAHDRNFKVGISWEGTPNKTRFLGKQLENHRTVPFDCLRTLQSLQGVSWYSLQKNPNEWPSGFPIKSLGSCLDEANGAFMDSAALMKHLDLVISIDGSIAHLAGALGIPVWVMLPCENDYRWFSNRSDSPWYPSMRLFRQKECGNWETVISKIKNELTNLLLLES